MQQDDSRAVAWARKTAEQGDSAAQFTLSGMYYFGQGVKKDDVKAYMWANLAAAQGLEEAVNILDLLLKELTPSQIEEGQRLAREWLAAH